MTDNERRPRHGTIHRITGIVQPIRFIETSEPDVFLAVTVDGERVQIGYGEQVTVEGGMLKHQTIRFTSPGDMPTSLKLDLSRKPKNGTG